MQIPSRNGQDRILHNEFGTADRTRQTSAQPPQSQKAIGHETDIRVANLRGQFEGQQIRPDVVATAKQQLVSGELLSRSAAEETARALIGIVEHF